MATKNGKRNMARRNSGGIGPLMLAFVAFVFGYLVAAVFDFNQMSSWVSAHMSSNDSIKTSQTKNASAKKHKTTPKLEFYTLLSQDHATIKSLTKKVSQPEIIPANINNTKNLPLHEPLVKETAKPMVASASKEKFILQLGSFKSKGEAEKMRAELMMKGFDVWITMLNQQDVNWYRVMTGPFTTRVEAQKLQTTFARLEHIDGMVRKIDV